MGSYGPSIVGHKMDPQVSDPITKQPKGIALFLSTKNLFASDIYNKSY